MPYFERAKKAGKIGGQHERLLERGITKGLKAEGNESLLYYKSSETSLPKFFLTFNRSISFYIR